MPGRVVVPAVAAASLEAESSLSNTALQVLMSKSASFAKSCKQVILKEYCIGYRRQKSMQAAQQKAYVYRCSNTMGKEHSQHLELVELKTLHARSLHPGWVKRFTKANTVHLKKKQVLSTGQRKAGHSLP